MRFISVTVLALALAASQARAEEGKWTPQQVLQQGEAWVKAQGFELPLDKLWNEQAGGGLLANAVQLPGCSGSFISPDGLLITNHHCVVGVLQEHSTPQQNIGRDGFLARTRAEEKPSKTYRVQVPRAFRDVTSRVLAAVPAGADDLARFKAVEAAEKAIVAECEKTPGTRCQFATFDGGLFFTLTEFEEIRDVRLVYAPPEQVGNYGGEVDNWSWPRHSGDFSLLRAYVDGKPYQPKYWFPVSPEGVKPGDAVAVLGYPGRSYRAWVADEMAERESRWFPTVRELNAEWIAILEQFGRRSPEVAIAVEDELRSLENTRKNADGQIAGLRRGRILEKQRAADARVKAWAATAPNGAAALEAYAGLVRLNEERLKTWDRDFLLDLLARGPRALRWPTQLARRATEGQKPDLEREPGYMERDLARMRDQLERDQRRYVEDVDKALFRSWLKRALALPQGQRIDAIDKAFGGLDDAAVSLHLNQLYAQSTVFDLAARKAMFDESPDALRARKDPLLVLGFALDAERLALKARRDAAAGATLRLRPEWRRAVIGEAGRPVAPDANSSLRVTFGRVQGYSPREALTASPQTTLAGVIEKHTGQDPFDAPAKVREAIAAGKVGRWGVAALGGQVPVNFLATCDTTGGNSGSPTIDGKGRLVGVNFDRVWENVANDFGYNPDIARNVNVDVRYLLWMLDQVEGATDLLKELGVQP